MSHVIRLDIPYPSRILRPEDKPEDVSLMVIMEGINPSDESQRRRFSFGESVRWSRIQDKILDQDGKAVPGEIELSEEQFDFLYAKIKDTRFPPQFATPVTVFLDHLESVKNGKEKG